MKILHISCIAPPDTGGIGMSASEMVQRLRARGADAILAAPVRRRQDGEEDASWITRLPAPLRWGNAAVLSGVKSLIRQHDVVHLHYPFFGTAEAVAQDCLFLKKPLVTTFHMDATASGLLGAAFQGYRGMVQPAVLRASRRVFVSSRDYAEHASIRRFARAHPERIVELPFGVDAERFTPGNRHAAQQLFQIPEGVRVIGFVGGMDAAHAFKGLPVLLQALAALSSDVHAFLVGDGAKRDAFEKQAKNLGIADRCHFAGRVPPDRLADAYRAMDVFAFPSTNASEAFGLAAVEAMACGIPVVASDVPGVRWVVAETGMLVPPSNALLLADAFRRLLDDAPLCVRLSAAARARAIFRFNWERHVDGLMQAYRAVCDGAKDRG